MLGGHIKQAGSVQSPVAGLPQIQKIRGCVREGRLCAFTLLPPPLPPCCWRRAPLRPKRRQPRPAAAPAAPAPSSRPPEREAAPFLALMRESGREYCMDRVCQYVVTTGVTVELRKKDNKHIYYRFI